MQKMENWRIAAWILDQDGPPHMTKIAVGIIEKMTTPEAETSVSKM
jgi:hypothetical protein